MEVTIFGVASVFLEDAAWHQGGGSWGVSRAEMKGAGRSEADGPWAPGTQVKSFIMTMPKVKV